MKWGCVGLNYRTAPVEIRERFSVRNHEIPDLGRSFMELPGMLGCVILSTCNRMEIYFSREKESGNGMVDRWLLDRHQLEPELSAHFYHKDHEAVPAHLCRVLSGLDSMVLGETEIFGQVKDAYSLALESGLTEAHLNKLFQTAFSIGKKVRSTTSINRGATSVGSVAVDLAEDIFGDLAKTKVLILGAGEMSRVTAQALQSRGASGVFVANRSYNRAVELARKMGAEAIRFDHWTEHLKTVDIVIASTAAPHYIVQPRDIEPIRAERKYRSLFFIDISVPRNINPDVSNIDEVYVYDIDTLNELAESARINRARAMQDCENIIEREMKRFQTTSAMPSIIIGTRGSSLALVQARMTAILLKSRYPESEIIQKIIKTTGDIRTDVPLSEVAQASGIVDKGVFIKELENALAAGEIDVAVHSLKDMPTLLDERFRLAAVLPRASMRDVIVSRHGRGGKALPQGGVVATSSVRRRRQLQYLRPDITVCDIRGNVPTRLEKLALSGEWDAILLAQAGLDRLGLTPDLLAGREIPLYVTPCDPDEFLPAAGQGAIALEIRADNNRLASLLAPLNDHATEKSVRAEREFLRLLGAGCSTPVGVLTQYAGEQMTMKGRVFDESHELLPPWEGEVTGESKYPEAIAERLWMEWKKANPG